MQNEKQHPVDYFFNNDFNIPRNQEDDGLGMKIKEKEMWLARSSIKYHDQRDDLYQNNNNNLNHSKISSSLNSEKA